MAKQTPVLRRRLSDVVRKSITSYYTPEEAQAISNAAKKLNITMSSFVANAALREAKVVNSKNK